MPSSPLYPSGIPLLCFMVLLPFSIPWSQISITWLAVVHILACLSPHIGSVLYHLFMNHEGGAPVYHTLLALDMCGICMINTLGKSRRPGGGWRAMFGCMPGPILNYPVKTQQPVLRLLSYYLLKAVECISNFIFSLISSTEVYPI